MWDPHPVGLHLLRRGVPHLGMQPTLLEQLALEAALESLAVRGRVAIRLDRLDQAVERRERGARHVGEEVAVLEPDGARVAVVGGRHVTQGSAHGRGGARRVTQGLGPRVVEVGPHVEHLAANLDAMGHHGGLQDRTPVLVIPTIVDHVVVVLAGGAVPLALHGEVGVHFPIHLGFKPPIS
jgi:hypothetical protein